MDDAQPALPETRARIATELAATGVRDEDIQAVGDLLSGLVLEMGSMRAMEIHDTEPATTYDPSLP